MIVREEREENKKKKSDMLICSQLLAADSRI
jgi:hypothetical protein